MYLSFDASTMVHQRMDCQTGSRTDVVLNVDGVLAMDKCKRESQRSEHTLERPKPRPSDTIARSRRVIQNRVQLNNTQIQVQSFISSSLSESLL